MLRLADVERGDQRTREKLAPFELVRRAEKRLLLFSRLLADNAVSDHSGQISTDEQYALAEYLDLGGSGSGIPVEQDGGSGTAGSHWNEETFANELMTGYINNGDNPYSAMSAASFADLGYTISNVDTWADAYVLPA